MIVDLPRLHTLFIGSGAFTNTYHFDYNQFPNLGTLSLAYDMIYKEDSFELSRMSNLTKFTCLEPVCRNRPVETIETKSFRITNCNALKSFLVNYRCFADYGHFEVSNCPAINYLNFGAREKNSHSFLKSSFLVRGNNHVGFLFVDCPSLSSIYVGERSFEQSLTIVMESNNKTANYKE